MLFDIFFMVGLQRNIFRCNKFRASRIKKDGLCIFFLYSLCLNFSCWLSDLLSCALANTRLLSFKTRIPETVDDDVLLS